jgi:hypothetical protein
LLLKSGSRVEWRATLDARRRAASRSAFKSCRDARNAAAAFDMSETAQAEGGIVIKDKRFDFETCEKNRPLQLKCTFALAS